jgi:putative transposase
MRPGYDLRVAHAFSRLHVHLVFSTKRRAPSLHDEIREALHRYMSGVLENQRCPAVLINSVEDHVHVLFELSRSIAVSEVVEELKKSSSKWIKTQGAAFAGFAWQTGYGAFAVSSSNVGRVRDYVARQREHHRRLSFEDEHRALLRRHGLDPDDPRAFS